MTPIRITSSLLWLLLACILFKYSTAHAHQVAAPVGAISVNQELSNDVVVGASLRDSWIKGRKMLVERKEEMMKEKGVNGGSSEISGATHFIRKCQHERKKVFNIVECRLSEGSFLPMKVKLVGHLSFSADYNVPRHHPPKNN